MTASLFYEQKYDWSLHPINEAFEVHRPKEVNRARRFISDVSKLPHYKQDELYEFLFHTTEKMKKDKELTEWLEKFYQRWKRYKGLERDLVEQMIGV